MSRVSGSRPSRIVLLVLVFVLSALVYGCSGDASGDSATAEPDSVAEETSVETTGGGSAGNVPEDTNSGGDGGDGIIRGEDGEDNDSVVVPDTREVEVRLSGDEGVRFGGFCKVSGERERIKGSVPDGLVYETNGGSVECVIRKRGGEGTLEVVMRSGNSRSVQRTNASGGEIRIATSGGGATSSTSTSSSSSSSSQSGSSVSITRGADSSGGD